MITKTSILLVTSFLIGTALAHTDKDHQGLNHYEIASLNPDRIFLTFYGDAASGRAVTWRTGGSNDKTPAYAEIAKAEGGPYFADKAIRIDAKTEQLDLNVAKSNKQGVVKYHSAIFKDLEPETLYAYRVGDGGNYWSEWIQFKTASKEAKPFKFVYFGDAQNGILSHWSRTFRMSYQTAPDASFALHAGDLINQSHNDNEWAEWYKAGGFVHSQWSGVPVTGNHEYIDRKTKDLNDTLAIQWRPQFTLPVVTELPEELHETVYTLEYQGMQMIVLNSNKLIAEQSAYLKAQLEKPGFRWKVVTFHHSMFSPRRGISEKSDLMEKEWRPLLEKYNVDLVLQGHDHAYTRGQVPVRAKSGFEKDSFQTMYVTSVSGPKQYPINPGHMKSFIPKGLETIRNGEHTQFFQVISVDGNNINYKAYTTTGDLYDEAIITKDFKTGKKTIVQKVPDLKERTFKNTPKVENGKK